MVKAKGLKYEYTVYEGEPVFALKGLDVWIRKGEFCAVIGANGSGKSTFAKLTNALIKPTDGEILVNGLDVRDDKNLWDVRRGAGMVFQNPDNQLVATIVEEDVAFGVENLGVESQEIEKRVYDALEAVGMTGFAKEQPHMLSGGQKQRVAIAGVLAMCPNCLILDEPTAMLDPIGRRDVMEIITKLNKEKEITVILITHYMDEAVKADRIVVVDNGRVLMDGAPREIFSNIEKIREIGLDVPQTVEIASKLSDMGYDIAKNILTVEELTKEVEMCLLSA